MVSLNGAKEFARNPLGIIALFISLIYGLATLLLSSSAEKLTQIERWPLILFIVLFPVLILITFYKLVTAHHGKLYAPGDFKDDKSFLRTLSPEEQKKKLDAEVEESLGEVELSVVAKENTIKMGRKWNSNDDSKSDHGIKKQGTVDHRKFREELEKIERIVVEDIANESNLKVQRDVGIGGTDAKFDAFLETNNGCFTFVEVKVLRSPMISMMILDRLLYSAVVADKFFRSKFKLILVIVYAFEKSELKRVENNWRQKINNCPANIELRFISKSELDIQ